MDKALFILAFWTYSGSNLTSELYYLTRFFFLKIFENFVIIGRKNFTIISVQVINDIKILCI